MSQRNNLQKAILVIFALGTGGGIYYLFQHYFPSIKTGTILPKTAHQADSGISEMIGRGISGANQWWNGTEEKKVALSAHKTAGSEKVSRYSPPPYKLSEKEDRKLSEALSSLENDPANKPQPVMDSHTVPTPKVLKEREKALLRRRAEQERQNQAIQRARAKEMKKMPKMLFASDILQAKKSLGFSPQGYHLWENANGFLITNPQTHRFELVLETGTCAGALGQDTPELKQVFRYKKAKGNTGFLTLYQANQEGQSAMDSFACQVGLTLKNGTVVHATEKNCTYWHGAECAFSIPLGGLRALPDLK